MGDISSYNIPPTGTVPNHVFVKEQTDFSKDTLSKENEKSIKSQKSKSIKT